MRKYPSVANPPQPAILTSPELEIRKILTASTAHITSTDNQLLAEELADSEGGVCSEYGYVLNLLKFVYNDRYSSSLLKLIMSARVMQCTHLNLDCDGPVYPELEKFHW